MNSLNAPTSQQLGGTNLPDGIDAINQNLSGQNNRLYAVFERLERIANRLHGMPAPTGTMAANAGSVTSQLPQATPICTRDWLGAMASLIDKIEGQIHRIQPDA